MGIPWEALFVVFLVVFVFLLLFKRTRDRIYQAFDKVVTIITSKRFITLTVATIAELKGIQLSAMWFVLAGGFIGIDYLKNEGVLQSLSERLRNKPQQE